jgi:hypothetical protein
MVTKTYKKFSADSTTSDEDFADTDITYGPSQHEQLSSDRWDNLVNSQDPTGDGTATYDAKESSLHTILGTNDGKDRLSLADLKVMWRKKVRQQAKDAFGESLFVTNAANRAAYKQAFQIAKDAIEAATTKAQVKAISFVVPV